MKIINGNVNMKYNDYNDVVPTSLRAILQNDFISLTPLHVPIEEHDNTFDENNRRESIGFEISVSI